MRFFRTIISVKAVAVFPGKNDGARLVEESAPCLDDVADGRGVLVRALCIGVDGTDRQTLSGVGAPPEGEPFRIPGQESFGIVEVVGPDVNDLGRGDHVVATVRRPGTSPYDATRSTPIARTLNARSSIALAPAPRGPDGPNV